MPYREHGDKGLELVLYAHYVMIERVLIQWGRKAPTLLLHHQLVNVDPVVGQVALVLLSPLLLYRDLWGDLQ